MSPDPAEHQRRRTNAAHTRQGASKTMSGLGWWAISGEALIEALRRASSGEDPDLLYAELYANTDRRSNDND